MRSRQSDERVGEESVEESRFSSEGAAVVSAEAVVAARSGPSGARREGGDGSFVLGSCRRQEEQRYRSHRWCVSAQRSTHSPRAPEFGLLTPEWETCSVFHPWRLEISSTCQMFQL